MIVLIAFRCVDSIFWVKVTPPFQTIPLLATGHLLIDPRPERLFNRVRRVHDLKHDVFVGF